MIFKYKDLQASKNVELNITNIRSHQASIIRSINLLSNGTLFYNEIIDDSLIELIPENVPEERLILGEISQNNFYFDSVRNRYLGLDTEVVEYYLDGTNRKNMYMYQIPGISSLSVPYRLFDEYCIIAIEAYTTTSIPNNTNIIQIRNTVNNSILLTLSNNSGVSASEFYDDTLNNIVTNGSKLGAYILDYGLNTPVIKIFLKKTYYPIGG
jgi:hypothetical protein